MAAKNLKVTWLSGAWDVDQSVAEFLVPADNLQTAVVGETLVFRRAVPGDVVGGHVYLIVPESRLISAVEVPEDTTNG